jgi:hypothetical protein
MGAAVAPTDAESGAGAVEYSDMLNRMKSATSTEIAGLAGNEAMKSVAGRTFVQVGNVWKEVEVRGPDEAKKPERKTLKIKYLSDAYFDLLAARPDLKKVFALGEQVEFDLGEFHIVIGPEGEEKLSKGQLDAMKKK